ncbi:MAG: histidine kinase dimerization/phosphoacceptor domain -containing protein [Bacteroidota bacterium]
MRIASIAVITLACVQSAFAQFPTYAQFKSSVFKNEADAKAAILGLPKIKNDTVRIAQINELAKYLILLSRSYGSSDTHQQAIGLLKEGVRLSEIFYKPTSPCRYESTMLLAHVYSMSDQTQEGEDLYHSVINQYHASGNKEGEGYAWFRFIRTLLDLELTTEEKRKKIFFAFDKSIELYHEVGGIAMEIYLERERLTMAFRLEDKNPEDGLIALMKKSLANGCVHLPSIYLNLAWINRYRGNHNAALPYSLEALKVLKESGDSADIANYYGEIALEYGELGRSTESIANYKKCIDNRERMGKDQYVIYRTATLMTAEMIKNKQAAEGFAYLRSLEHRNPPHADLERALIEHGMANCLAASGDFPSAEKYYMSMVKGYLDHERNDEIVLMALLDAAKFFVSRKQFGKAEAYRDQIVQLFPNTSIAIKSDIELLLFKMDSTRSDLKGAIRHYQLFKNYNDTIFNKVKSEQIEALHIRFSSEQKDQNIALLKQQAALQQANLAQSEILRNSLLGGTVMLILLLSLLYNRYRLKTRSNLLLQKQQEEISKKNFAQQLLLNEKDWLVREIHHRVKNNFHMVVGLMGTQSAYIKNNEALQALEDSKHRIQTMSLIHQKLYQSENLSATLMSDCVYELTSYLKESFDVSHILFVVECEPISLELSYSLPLGLILNEAITNSIKYAFPDNREGTIRITLAYASADNIRLVISDNGIGIPIKPDGDVRSSMGMNLMSGLTEDIGGTFQIRNENGTTVQIDFHYETVKVV